MFQPRFVPGDEPIELMANAQDGLDFRMAVGIIDVRNPQLDREDLENITQIKVFIEQFNFTTGRKVITNEDVNLVPCT